MPRKKESTAATRSARGIAYRLVGLQLLVVTAIALAWGLVSGRPVFVSFMLGGLTVVLPSFMYARRLFMTTSARQAKQIMVTFLVGELIKLTVSGILLVIVIKYLPVKLLPLILGFVSAQFGFWLGPIFLDLNIKSQ